MPSVNRVLLLGNLTREPKLEHGQVARCRFGIAVNERYGDRETTLFIECTAWRKTAEIVAEYCEKGSQVFIEGRLELNEWTTKDGQNRREIRVVADRVQLLGGRSQRREPAPAASYTGPPADDEIPF